VSKHLRELKRVGLVKCRAQGRHLSECLKELQKWESSRDNQSARSDDTNDEAGFP